MTTRKIATQIALLTIATSIAVALTTTLLGPQLGQLFELVGLHGAETMGYALALTLFAASFASSLMSGGHGKALVIAAIGLSVCVAATRLKVVSDEMAVKAAQYEAAKATYEAQVANRNEAIADAKSDPDLNAKAPYLSRKREARKNLATARAIPVPTAPTPYAPTALDTTIAVAGPAGIEFISATLVELMGIGCGMGAAGLLVLLRTDRKDDEAPAEADAEVEAEAKPKAKREVSKATRKRISEGLKRYHAERKRKASRDTLRPVTAVK